MATLAKLAYIMPSARDELSGWEGFYQHLDRETISAKNSGENVSWFVLLYCAIKASTEYFKIGKIADDEFVLGISPVHDGIMAGQPVLALLRGGVVKYVSGAKTESTLKTFAFGRGFSDDASYQFIMRLNGLIHAANQIEFSKSEDRQKFLKAGIESYYVEEIKDKQDIIEALKTLDLRNLGQSQENHSASFANRQDLLNRRREIVDIHHFILHQLTAARLNYSQRVKLALLIEKHLGNGNLNLGPEELAADEQLIVKNIFRQLNFNLPRLSAPGEAEQKQEDAALAINQDIKQYFLNHANYHEKMRGSIGSERDEAKQEKYWNLLYTKEVEDSIGTVKKQFWQSFMIYLGCFFSFCSMISFSAMSAFAVYDAVVAIIGYFGQIAILGCVLPYAGIIATVIAALATGLQAVISYCFGWEQTLKFFSSLGDMLTAKLSFANLTASEKRVLALTFLAAIAASVNICKYSLYKLLFTSLGLPAGLGWVLLVILGIGVLLGTFSLLQHLRINWWFNMWQKILAIWNKLESSTDKAVFVLVNVLAGLVTLLLCSLAALADFTGIRNAVHALGAGVWITNGTAGLVGFFSIWSNAIFQNGLYSGLVKTLIAEIWLTLSYLEKIFSFIGILACIGLCVSMAVFLPLASASLLSILITLTLGLTKDLLYDAAKIPGVANEPSHALANIWLFNLGLIAAGAISIFAAAAINTIFSALFLLALPLIVYKSNVENLADSKLLGRCYFFLTAALFTNLLVLALTMSVVPIVVISGFAALIFYSWFNWLKNQVTPVLITLTIITAALIAGVAVVTFASPELILPITIVLGLVAAVTLSARAMYHNYYVSASSKKAADSNSLAGPTDTSASNQSPTILCTVQPAPAPPKVSSDPDDRRCCWGLWFFGNASTNSRATATTGPMAVAVPN